MCMMTASVLLSFVGFVREAPTFCCNCEVLPLRMLRAAAPLCTNALSCTLGSRGRVSRRLTQCLLMLLLPQQLLLPLAVVRFA